MTYLLPGEPGLGETFVQGKTPAIARALLAACDDLGIDQTIVRASDGGFVVPSAVADQAVANHLDAAYDGGV